jgi:hypothetical protein
MATAKQREIQKKGTNNVSLKKIFNSAALRKQATHFVGTRAGSSYTPPPPLTIIQASTVLQ